MKINKYIVAASAGAVAALLFASGAGALKRENAEETLAKYEKTGDSVSCLSLSAVRDTDVLDDYTMLVKVRGGDVYLNELSGRCAGLGFEERYIHKTSLNSMCKGDIITVIGPSGDPRGSCSFGEFEKLSEIELKEE